MNYLKMLFVLTISIAVSTLLLCTNKPTEPNNIQDRVAYKGLYGKLVNIDGKAISGVKVKAVNVANGLQKVSKGVFISASQPDSVSTDSSGYYSFESLVAGNYNLQGDYSNGKLVVLITGVIYDSTGAIMEVKTDTLQAPGQISGVVNTYAEDNGGVLCYIPGTSYLAMTDDTGGFVLSNIPQGNYSITYRKDGLKTISDTGIEVHSGERTKLLIKNMEADPAYPPPAPAGLNVTYDTLHGCAIIQWKPVIVFDLAGYIVYRNDTASTTPQQISKNLVKGTSYIDTVFSDLMDTNDLAYAYRIKAQDKDANLSTVYSKPFSINTPSPTKVRTFFSWNYLNTIADSASINDTVSISIAYRNATRKNVKLIWYVGNKDTVFRSVNDSSFAGNDTIKYAWPLSSKPKIYVSIIDQTNTTWWDSTTIKIVKDVPVANAGADTTVSINASVPFKGTATQQFGTIVMYKWDFDGDSTFDDSSTTTGSATHTYTHEAVYNAKLLVRDDDRNEATIIRNIIVKNNPPIIKELSPDTVVSIYDSIKFSAVVYDSDDAINEMAWDYNNDGIFEQVSQSIAAGVFTYALPGNYLSVFRATDAGGKSSYDTVKISVLRDTPIPSFGNDTIISIGSSVTLQGTVTQRFGIIVMYKWDYDGDGLYDDSSAANATRNYTYMHDTIYYARFYVRDDDGNDSTAEKRIVVINKAPTIVSLTHDTTVSVNDSLILECAAIDSDGTIAQYAWDINSDSIMDFFGTSIKVRYTRIGLATVSVQVTDNYGKITNQKIQVNVVPYRFAYKWGNLGNGLGQFYHPGAIVVDSKENIYVVDEGNNRIQKFRKDGTFITAFLGYNAQELSIDNNDIIYLCGGSNITKMDTTGIIVGTISLSISPFRCTVDPVTKYIYATSSSDQKVYQFDSIGVLKRSWGGLGTDNGQFSKIQGIAADGAGNVIVGDYQLWRVTIFDSSANYISSFSTRSTGEINPIYLCIDKYGRIIIGTVGGGYRIDIYDSDYTFISILGGNGNGNGQFDGATPRLFSRNGILYTTDYLNNRVQVFK